MTSRIDIKSWKTAWNDLFKRAQEQLSDLDWCWYTTAFLLYEEEKESIEKALGRSFESTGWWSDWSRWKDRFEELRPGLLGQYTAVDQLYLPSDLPTPPEEPSDVWTKTRDLLHRGNRFEAIGGAVVRLILAEGRTARELQSSKQVTNRLEQSRPINVDSPPCQAKLTTCAGSKYTADNTSPGLRGCGDTSSPLAQMRFVGWRAGLTGRSVSR